MKVRFWIVCPEFVSGPHGSREIAERLLAKMDCQESHEIIESANKPDTGRSACFNCGEEVRTSYHDGRNFTYVHTDQGQSQCYVNGSFTGTRATPTP